MNLWLDITEIANRCSPDTILNKYELVMALCTLNKEIRLCEYITNGFAEVSLPELQQKCAQKSLVSFAKEPNHQVYLTDILSPELPSLLQQAYSCSDSRRQRLDKAVNLIINKIPKLFKGIIKIGWKVLLSIIKLLFSIKRSFGQQKAPDTLSSENLQNIVNFTAEDTVLTIGQIPLNIQQAYLASDVGAVINYVLDAAPLKEENKLFFQESDIQLFKEYINWITMSCAFLLFASEAVKDDIQSYQTNMGMPLKESIVIERGINKNKEKNKNEDRNNLESMGIKGDFILLVGDINYINNYETIYKAYTILSDRLSKSSLPNLIIVSNAVDQDKDDTVINKFFMDPRICNCIILVSPTAQDLDCLYRNCMFFMSASFNEVSNRHFAQAMAYNKIGLLAKNEQVEKYYGNSACYIDPLDPMAWSNEIIKILDNSNMRFNNNDCQCPLWPTSAQNILTALEKIKIEETKQGPSLYFDFTMSFKVCLYSNSKVHGIPRAELMLAREMSRVYPSTRYAVFISGKCVIIEKSALRYILGYENIDAALSKTKKNFAKILKEIDQPNDVNTSPQAFWLICSVLPSRIQKYIINLYNSKERKANPKTYHSTTLPFKKGDIVFSASGSTHDKESDLIIDKEIRRIGFKWSQVIYDLTTILYPQTHLQGTIENYGNLLDFTFAISDLVFYGGKTCMNDAMSYLHGKDMPHHIAVPIEFGNNILKSKATQANENTVLESMGINRKYILSVGTIQPRKNHETLYQAYLRMATILNDDLPQLVFVGGGHPGWKCEDLLHTLWRDERIENKILVLSPSDEQLDVLYRNCLFTVLPSQYEGWSLTLPESFGYGKFCLASDVAPLREAGVGLAEFIHPFDTAKWAERMLYYFEHEDELEWREEIISMKWKSTTWRECAQQIYVALNDYFLKP